MTPVLSILEVMRESALFGLSFPMASWQAWIRCASVLFGLTADLADDDRTFIDGCLGGRSLPTQPVTEGWLIIGRRGGKSRFAALVAIFLACFRDYQSILAPGEHGIVMIIAADRKQAGIVQRYVSGLLHTVPMLEALIAHETKESVEFTHRITIEIHTASYRSIRGRTVVGAICVEVSFWRSEAAPGRVHERSGSRSQRSGGLPARSAWSWQPDPFTREESERLVATAAECFPEWHAWLLTGLRTGLRAGELLGLQWDDVDRHGRYLGVTRSIVKGTQTTPKNHQQRRVDMSPQLRAVLRRWRAGQNAESLARGRARPVWIFPSSTGTWLDESKMRKAFNQILDRAGLHRRGPHQMRHTFASLLLQAGAPITYVSRQIGHRDSAITLRVYAHWLPDTGAEKGVDRLDDASSRILYASKARAVGESDPPKPLERNGEPPGTRTPNPQIKSSIVGCPATSARVVLLGKSRLSPPPTSGFSVQVRPIGRQLGRQPAAASQPIAERRGPAGADRVPSRLPSRALGEACRDWPREI